jgi:hypothetical protein
VVVGHIVVFGEAFLLGACGCGKGFPLKSLFFVVLAMPFRRNKAVWQCCFCPNDVFEKWASVQNFEEIGVCMHRSVGF